MQEDHSEDMADGPAEQDRAADAQSIDAAALEALLFSSHHPLTAAQVADVLGLPVSKGVKQAVAGLNETYEQTGRSFRIEQVAGGYQMLTPPEHGPLLQKLHAREADARLTKAAQETLAVIAYKQPVLRTDIEAIRGVSCGETIRSLMEKRLVKIAGRAELPGRPILYGTTRRFLESFGLNSLKDLPQSEGASRNPAPLEQP
jgi:segregation and condensation protein B